MIHNECRGNKINKQIKGYQTVTNIDLQSYPEKEEQEVTSSV